MKKFCCNEVTVHNLLLFFVFPLKCLHETPFLHLRMTYTINITDAIRKVLLLSVGYFLEMKSSPLKSVKPFNAFSLL